MRAGMRRLRGSALSGLILALVGIALVAAYAWFGPRGLAPRSVALEQVVIATNTDYVGSCPVMAAARQGYFAKEGILAVIQEHSSGYAALEAVLQGKANLGTAADIPVMFAALNQHPVRVIASIFNTEKDTGVVARRDRGIVTPVNLKGKRIGVTLSTSGHFTLDAMLNRQRILPAEVSIRAYPPEQLPAALAQGEVDAVATWEPFMAAAAAKLGSNAVVFDGEDIYESIYNVAGLRHYIDQHPETIKKILRALHSGAQFCSDTPGVAHTLLKTVMRPPPAGWPADRFNIVLDQGLILALEDEARWAVKNKLTNKTEIPNFLDYIYLDGLEAVMPSAVTIIH
ncbi:NitT/TauT family transport system substrate-binding protein [Oxalobacteraceae bacterium GrIS 1.11]